MASIRPATRDSKAEFDNRLLDPRLCISSIFVLNNQRERRKNDKERTILHNTDGSGGRESSEINESENDECLVDELRHLTDRLTCF